MGKKNRSSAKCKLQKFCVVNKTVVFVSKQKLDRQQQKGTEVSKFYFGLAVRFVRTVETFLYLFPI